MALNPYAELAKVAGLLGQNDATRILTAGAKAQRSVEQKGKEVEKSIKATTGFASHPTRGAIAGRGSNSLPGIRTWTGVIGQGLKSSGKYDGNGVEIEPPFIASRLIPMVRLTKMADGGVQSAIVAFSVYTPFISPQDWKKLARLAQHMVATAQRLSKGRLTYPMLRQKNHPYGHGLYPPSARPDPKTGKFHRSQRRRGLGRLTARKGVSNLAVVNIHTGDFYNAWAPLVKQGRLGVTLGVVNHSEMAEWLAFGTKRMRAHGPFLTAVQLFRGEFAQLWKEVTQRAYAAYSKSRRSK